MSASSSAAVVGVPWRPYLYWMRIVGFEGFERREKHRRAAVDGRIDKAVLASGVTPSMHDFRRSTPLGARALAGFRHRSRSSTPCSSAPFGAIFHAGQGLDQTR